MNSSFSFRRLGVISPISSPRCAVCFGGSKLMIWSPIGTASRHCSTCSVTSSPVSSTGNLKLGPATMLTLEKVAASRSTVSTSSCPATITTPWCGSRHTRRPSSRKSKYG